MPSADEEARVVAMDDDECEVTLELRERAPHGLDEVAFVVPLDEVRDGLRVGLGGEAMPLAPEPLLQLAVVLDDPVEDDGEALGIAAGERVRIPLGDPPWVAQRVCPRPVVAGERPSPAAWRRLSRFPTARTYSSPSASRSAMPAES